VKDHLEPKRKFDREVQDLQGEYVLKGDFVGLTEEVLDLERKLSGERLPKPEIEKVAKRLEQIYIDARVGERVRDTIVGLEKYVAGSKSEVGKLIRGTLLVAYKKVDLAAADVLLDKVAPVRTRAIEMLYPFRDEAKRKKVVLADMKVGARDFGFPPHKKGDINPITPTLGAFLSVRDELIGKLASFVDQESGKFAATKEQKEPVLRLLAGLVNGIRDEQKAGKGEKDSILSTFEDVDNIAFMEEVFAQASGIGSEAEEAKKDIINEQAKKAGARMIRSVRRGLK
jgi:hypothetical protein